MIRQDKGKTTLEGLTESKNLKVMLNNIDLKDDSAALSLEDDY